MPTAELAPPADALAPVVLPADALVVPSDPTLRWYELGVIGECPKQSLTVPGTPACFSRFRGNPQLGEDGQIVGRTEFPRAQLSPAEVEAVRSWVGNRVVKIAPAGTGGVFEKTDPRIRGQKGLRPLAEFLVMRPIPDAAITEPAPVSMAG